MSETAHTLETALQVLIDARAKIEKPEHWAKGWWAYTSDGLECDPVDTRAACWCMRGAIEFASGGFATAANVLAETVLGKATQEMCGDGIALFNDDKDRKHPEVLTAFDKAIESERAKVSA